MAYFRLLRPQQWIKNIFVFAALVFGQKLLDAHAVTLALLGFAALCLASSAVYVVNDIHDREEDRLHPRKRFRPIASGAVSVPAAFGLALVLVLCAVAGGYFLNPRFAIVVVGYLALQTFYTFLFKHMVILDVISIGIGFVLRAVAGGALIAVDISEWLVICTFTLCLFMGFSKRRCELNAMADAEANGTAAHKHRKTLALYTPDLLNHMTTLTAGVAILCFLLYTTDDRTITVYGAFRARALLYTLPLVVYAIFRFALLVEHGRVDGPTDVALRDRPFQIAVALWGLLALGIVYFGERVGAWLATLGDGLGG